jgi:hypothetical protein
LHIDLGSLRMSSPSPAVESVELRLAVESTGVQILEIRVAVDAEDHGLAIQHELFLPVLKCCPDDPWIAISPVVAIAGEQPHHLVLALGVSRIAVVLDLMDPAGPGRGPGLPPEGTAQNGV